MSVYPDSFRLEVGKGIAQSGGTLRERILASNAWGYWTLGDGAWNGNGTTARDLTGNGRDGTFNGIFTTGFQGFFVGPLPEGGSCAYFPTDSSNYVLIDEDMSGFTGNISFVVSINDTTTTTNVTHGILETTKCYLVVDTPASSTAPRTLRAILNIAGSGQSLSAASVIQPNQWHQVALTWDGTNMRLYVDSVQVAISGALAGALDMGTTLKVGVGNSTAWGGFISHLTINAGVLSLANLQSFQQAWEWTDLSDDVVGPMRWSIGLEGIGPADCMASIGQLDFELRNGAGNIGGVVGYYSQGNASKMPGWEFGIPVRLVFVYLGGEWTKFRGKIAVIDPDPGVHGPLRCRVTAYDHIKDLMDARVGEIDLQLDKAEGELIQVVMDALDPLSQPPARNIETGVDSYPYVFDAVSRDARAGGLINDLLVSSQAIGHCQGDGQFVMETRNGRVFLAQTANFAFDDDTMLYGGLTVPATRETVFSEVNVTIHPKQVDSAATTVVYAAEGTPPLIPPTSTVELWGDYRDPNDKSVAIGALDTVAPVSGTDYAANSAIDGSGTSLLSSVTVTATAFASSVKFTIVNAGGTPAYLVTSGGATLLQLRGKGVYDRAAQTFRKGSTPHYGMLSISIDMPYQDNPEIGQSTADFLEAKYSSLETQVDELTFRLNDDVTLMSFGLNVEPTWCVSVEETVTLTAVTKAITHRVSYEAEPTAHGIELRCTLGLAPGLPSAMWIWGTAGFSEWGETTYYGW